MKIIIDFQGAQSESRHRGIGRHTSALVRAFVKEASYRHDVWIVANAALGNVEEVRTAFDGLIDQNRIVAFQPPGQMAAMHGGSWGLIEAGEHLRENFIRSLEPDIVWCSSLFEGWVDSSVTSIGREPSEAKQAVTLYDLIPLSSPGRHLSDPAVRSWYYRKLGHLQRADVLLAISEYARSEAIDLLDIPPTRIHTISSAADEQFRPRGREEMLALQRALGIDRPFVLYVGGYDGRKNVELLIKAFSGLEAGARRGHALVLGGKITATQKATLMSLASKHGLRAKDVLFTNETSDEELVALYNLCSLFVFPSLQEGFGLPVLEAMACGAPVLAADATSLPEVVGCPEMLFPPTDPVTLARKMSDVLLDQRLSERYRAHGLSQARKFSWESSAKLALAALESVSPVTRSVRGERAGEAKPKLAFVSPMPPERTGIADYSAELLPSLERYYDIEVIVDQAAVDDSWVLANFPIRDAAWFRANAHRFDRVIYQVGNSPFHLYQLDLMSDFPGAVVLHDSYLGALSQWRAAHVGRGHEYLQRLYRAHGYPALLDDHAKGRAWSVQNYASNWEVLESAAGVIVHSQYAINEAARFYGKGYAREMRRVAFPKRRRPSARITSRNLLGIGPNDFVVCSFGMVAPTKLNHRLLSAWLESALASDVNCHLAFVGENHGGDYGSDLLATIRESAGRDRIRITGFVDQDAYHAWLEAADLAVQLRTESRGETSAAVFDCMAQGIPVIVNAHATFAELDPAAVQLLPDLFDTDELTSALQDLQRDPERRRALSNGARAVIDTRHHPAVVATQYRNAIEDFASSHFLAREQSMVRRLSCINKFTDKDFWAVAAAMRRNRLQRGRRTMFVDVTAVVRSDHKTGVERVTRNIATELLRGDQSEIRVELVRCQGGQYVYCRDYACRLLGLDSLQLSDEIIEVSPGDIFFGLDWVADLVPGNRALYQSWRDLGASVYFLVHDLLPVLRPEFFPPGIDRMHGAWLHSIASFSDGIVCVSMTVAGELLNWVRMQGIARSRVLQIGYSYSGAELDGDSSKAPLADGVISEQVRAAVEQMRARPTFLMVGTIEPRKGHREVLRAFSRLWSSGRDVNLVIVGKLGWMMESFGEELLTKSETERRLFWLSGVSDPELREIYEGASALLVASEGEGFGLPIIEAARHGLPVVVRNLPVFREVAGANAHYFEGAGAEGLVDSLTDWLVLHQQGGEPRSSAIPRLSWRQSADNVRSMLLDTQHPNWIHRWRPDQSRPPIVGGSGLVLDLSQVGRELLRQGWAAPESWGCWTTGHTAKLKVGVQPPAGLALRLSLVASAFVLPSYPRQAFELLVNGESLGAWVHEYGEELKEQHWVIPSRRFPDWSTLELTVVQKDVVAPKTLGQSSDPRPLGLAVKEIAFSWVVAGDAAKLC